MNDAEDAADFLRELASLDLGAGSGDSIPPEIVREIQEVVEADVARHFARGESPDHRAWPPLKCRRGRPLIKSGALLGSARKMGSHCEVIWEQGRVVIVLDPGLLEPYGEFHDLGTGSIPARPFVGVSAEAMEVIEEIIGSWIGEEA